MNGAELAKEIVNCICDGYDDEEHREDTEINLYNELSQLRSDCYIRAALWNLCGTIRDLEEDRKDGRWK